MIITCILFALFNIIHFKGLKSSLLFSGTEFILQIFLSILSTILFTVVISLIVCTICDTETVLIESEELVPYKNEKIYIKEDFKDTDLYYEYNIKDKKDMSTQLTKNVFVSNNIKDKPKVEKYIYRYKNKIIRYMFFNFGNNKYIFYIPKNGIIKYNNSID